MQIRCQGVGNPQAIPVNITTSGVAGDFVLHDVTTQNKI